MKLNLRTVRRAAVLLWILLGQIPLRAAVSQAPAAQGEIQFFLTALGREDPHAVLQETSLSVRVDNTVAQVKGLRSVKDDLLLFAVVLDVSRSDASTASSLRQVAFQLFQGLATGENRGYLVLFNGSVGTSQAPITVSQAKNELESAAFGGGTAVYDAIETTCKQKLSKSGNPATSRRVIVLISDGEDNQSHVTHDKAEQAALEEGISVFSVVTRGPMAGPQGKKFLKEISQMTGGFATDDKDLNRAVSLSLGAIEAQWAVTVAPTQSADRKLHSLQIKCTQKDVRISAPDALFLE